MVKDYSLQSKPDEKTKKRIYRTDGSFYLVPLDVWQKHIKQNPYGMTVEKAKQRQDPDLDKAKEIPVIRVGEKRESTFVGSARKKED